MQTTTDLMTAEQFFDWVNGPDRGGKHYELDRGRVVEVSRPGENHGHVAANVCRILGNYTYAKKKGYVCGNDTGVIFERSPDSVLGPDVIYYEKKVRRKDLNPRYSDEVPQLIVEVLSPNDRISKVNARIGRFLDRGVNLAWLADPEDATITVYRANRAPKVFQRDDEITGEEVLPDFRLRVGEFFEPPGDEEDQPT